MKIYIKNVWDNTYMEVALENLQEWLDYEVGAWYIVDDIDNEVIYLTRYQE